MKAIITLFLLSRITLSIFAQSSDEQIIQNLEAAGTPAFLKTDTIFLKKMWHPDYVVRNPFNKIVGVKEIMTLIKVMKITQVEFESIIDKITINEDIATVMGHDEPNIKTAKDGIANEVKNQRIFTNIWRRQNGNWRMIAHQATNVNP